MHGPPTRPENTPETVEQLVNENGKLAYYFAQKYCAAGGIDFSEALSRAFEGLLRAAQLFDREKGTFGSYASIRIKQSIRRFFIDQRRQKRGGGIAIHVSIDSSTSQDADGSTYADIIPDDRDQGAFVALVGSDDASEIHQWILKLDDRERSVIVSRFGLHGEAPMTLQDIATPMGVSWQRIHQIQIGALAKLAFMARQRNRIEEHPEQN